MMKTFVIAMLLAVLGGAGSLAAQTVSVDYLDGKVELKTKTGTWQALTEGTKLNADAVLRITGGLAELSSGSTKLHLGKDGIYTLSTLLSPSAKPSGSNVAVLAGEKISKILGTKSGAAINTANMGARGAEQGAATLDWADDDSSATPETIDSLVQKKSWGPALKAVNDALAAKPAEPRALLFTKAQILAGQGRSAAALRALDQAALKKGEARYMESLLLYATQGLEAQDYDLVVAKTTEALPQVQDPELMQMFTLSQALALRGLGNEAQAKAKFQAVISQGASTPSGQEAKRLLGS